MPEADTLLELQSQTEEALNPTKTNISKGLGLSENPRKGSCDILKHHFCEICKIWAPPLSIHCDICNHCVKDFEGHSFMVSNDVGVRNKKHYIYLCLNLTIVFGIWFLEGLWTISLMWENRRHQSFSEITNDGMNFW